MYGVPIKFRMTNGSSVNSSYFQRLAEATGFRHKITPSHPKAQKEIAEFKLVKKTASIASQESMYGPTRDNLKHTSSV